MTEATTAFEYLKAKYNIQTFLHIYDVGQTAIIEGDFMAGRADAFFDKHKEEILKAIDDDEMVDEATEDGEIFDKFGLVMAFIRSVAYDLNDEYEDKDGPAAKYLKSTIDFETWRHIYDVNQSSAVYSEFSYDGGIDAFVDKYKEEIEGYADIQEIKDYLKELSPEDYAEDEINKEGFWDNDSSYKDDLFHRFVMEIADEVVSPVIHDAKGELIEEGVSEDYEAREYDSEVCDSLIKKAREGPLVGEDLLRLVYELGDVSKSDIVSASGYVSKKEDGGERLDFTAFYEALLKAKGVEIHEEAED